MGIAFLAITLSVFRLLWQPVLYFNTSDIYFSPELDMWATGISGYTCLQQHVLEGAVVTAGHALLIGVQRKLASHLTACMSG